MTAPTPTRDFQFTTFVSIRILRLVDSESPSQYRPPEISGTTTSEDEVVRRIRGLHYRILVVDDNDAFRKSLVFKLRQLYNATVEEAEASLIAIEKVGDGHGFDLVLMDVSMPGGDGIEACEIMRARGVEARIVLMSGHAENRAKAEAIWVPFLNKPIDNNALERILLACRGEPIS